MYFDTSIPGSLEPKRTVFTAIITPRPIGWISTLGPDGRANLALRIEAIQRRIPLQI